MTLTWAAKHEFTTDHNVAYTFKTRDGGRTRLLHYLKSEGGLAFFSPVTDSESTLTHSILRLYITAEHDDTVRVFQQCKFYGSWEKAPHECGKDCPLGV